MCLSVNTHEQKCYRGPADVEFLNLFIGNVLCFKKTSKYGATQLSIYTKDLYECSLKNIAFENTKKFTTGYRCFYVSQVFTIKKFVETSLLLRNIKDNRDF